MAAISNDVDFGYMCYFLRVAVQTGSDLRIFLAKRQKESGEESSRPDAKRVANSVSAATSGKSTHFLLSWSSSENSDVVKSDATMMMPRPRQFVVYYSVFGLLVILTYLVFLLIYPDQTQLYF